METKNIIIVVNDAYRKLEFVKRRTFNFVHRRTIELLYRTLVTTHSEYASVIWSPNQWNISSSLRNRGIVVLGSRNTCWIRVCLLLTMIAV